MERGERCEMRDERTVKRDERGEEREERNQRGNGCGFCAAAMSVLMRLLCCGPRCCHHCVAAHAVLW